MVVCFFSKADPEHEDKMKKRAELVVDLANKVPSKGGLHYRKLPEGVSGHDFLLFIKRNCPRVYSTAKTDGSGSGQKRRLQSREEGEEGEEGGEGGDVKRSKKRSKGVVDLQSALSDLRENLKNDIEMVRTMESITLSHFFAVAHITCWGSRSYISPRLLNQRSLNHKQSLKID